MASPRAGPLADAAKPPFAAWARSVTTVRRATTQFIPNPKSTTLMETIAYHEAGHAFMAIYVGARVRSVTIEPDRDDGPQREGDTQVLWHRGRMTDREFHEKGILVCLAGPVAEMIYTQEPFHPCAVPEVGSSRVDLQACKLEYSIVSPK